MIRTLPLGLTELERYGWNARWRCYLCRRLGVFIKASIRIFSGVGASGFPACISHEQDAFNEVGTRIIAIANHGYTVIAYRVQTDPIDGGPKLGPQLWKVTKK